MFCFSESNLLFTCAKHFKTIEVSREAYLTKNETFNMLYEVMLRSGNQDHIKSLSFNGHELIGDIDVYVAFMFNEDNSGIFKICSQYDTISVEFSGISDESPVNKFDSIIDILFFDGIPSSVGLEKILGCLIKYDIVLGYRGNTLYISVDGAETITWEEITFDQLLSKIIDRITSMINNAQNNIEWREYTEDLKLIQEIKDRRKDSNV